MLYRSNKAVPGKGVLLSALLIAALLHLPVPKAHSQIFPWYYTIEAKAGGGGIINPSGKVYVLRNNSQTFEIIPDLVHEIKEVEVDGVKIGPVASYTFENVTSNHKIEATFRDRNYIITASAGTGGTITGTGEILKKEYPNSKIVAVEHRANRLDGIDGIRTASCQVAFDGSSHRGGVAVKVSKGGVEGVDVQQALKFFPCFLRISQT